MAQQKSAATKVEQVPFLVIGDVYTDFRGTDYYLTGINRGSAKLIRLTDGAEVGGPERNVLSMKHREATDEDRAKVEEFEEARRANQKTLLPGQIVKLNEAKGRAAAARSFPGFDGDFVVTKVADKTVNIVPLGGFGNGLAYLRVGPALLDIVND